MIEKYAPRKHHPMGFNYTDIALTTILMVEFARRFRSVYTESEPLPSRLHEKGSMDACYCIDAPERIPAGGCEQLHIPDIDDEDIFEALQLVVYREALDTHDRPCTVNRFSSRVCEHGTLSCTVYHSD